MLTKNQIICFGTMNISFLEFQLLIWPIRFYTDARRTRTQGVTLCASGVHPVIERLRAPRLLRCSAQEADQ